MRASRSRPALLAPLPAPGLGRPGPAVRDRAGASRCGPTCCSPTSRRARSTSPSRPRWSSCCRRCATRSGTAMLFISHDLAVGRGCPTGCVMREGRIVEQGPVRNDAAPAAPSVYQASCSPPCPGDRGGRRCLRCAAWSSATGRCSPCTAYRSTVPAGPFGVGLIGESGSGKTTIARALVRLATPASGAVTMDGVDVAGSRPALQGVPGRPDRLPGRRRDARPAHARARRRSPRRCARTRSSRAPATGARDRAAGGGRARARARRPLPARALGRPAPARRRSPGRSPSSRACSCSTSRPARST